MSIRVEVLHDLFNAREIIDAQIAHIRADRREVEEGYGYHSSGKFVEQAQADFRRHNGDAADFVFHHSRGGLARFARIVIRVAEDCVVAKLGGANLETLDHFREEGVLDIGDDDPERAALARSQAARMNIRNVSQPPNCRKDKAASLRTNFARLVQDVRNGGGRDIGRFRNIANG